MNNITFSILIPAYKSSYLRKCLDSVLYQTYKNYEIIIVDDDSPEDLKSIVDEYPTSQIKYFRNEKNCGSVNVVDNWNKCLALAKGNFSICMGDDDMIPKNSLEEYAKMIEKYPYVDVFHARTVLIDQNDSPYFITNTRREYESVFSLIRHRMNGELQFVGDFCYRTERLRQKGGFVKFPLAWGSDDATAYMMSKESGIVNLGKPTFYYRVNTQSITNTGNTEIKISAIQQQRQWLISFLSQCKQLTEEDQLSLRYIKKELNLYLNRKISGHICEELNHNKCRIFYWFCHREEYKINMNTLIYALLRSLK